MTPDDIDELRGHGLTDTEIFEVALTAAARAFFSKSLDSMGAELDEALADSARLFYLVELRHSAEWAVGVSSRPALPLHGQDQGRVAGLR